jgi:hypothetical protein
MAIEYVGGLTSSRAGSTSTVGQTLTGLLTGGLSASAAQGDLVFITIGVASASGYAPTTLAVSGWTNGTFRVNTGVTNYSYQQYSYKFMTATPDSSVTIPSSGHIRNAQTWIVQVFRGIDAAVFDATTVFASGTATGRPNPGSITPVTSGAWILWTGVSSAGTGTAFTAPTDFSTDWLGVTQSDTYDSTQGAGYYTGWTSGAYDPAAITAGGTTGSTDSWVAETIALKPAATGQSLTHNPTDTATATDSVTFGISQVSLDTATATESLLMDVSKVDIDTAAVTDVPVFSLTKETITETAAVTDVPLFSFNKEIIIESVSASDFFSYELIPYVPTITLRLSKGSALTAIEFDGNLDLLNTKKIEHIIMSIVSASSITPAGSEIHITALSEAITINAPNAGYNWDGVSIIIRIKDNGSSRGLSWNSIYRAIGFTIPVATISGIPMYFGMVYNSADSKWDVIAYTTIN